MNEKHSQHPRVPRCTYRLQFNRDFTFADARAITAYLDELGVSDAYASPYFQARAESLHGYDITDHNKLNAAIGSREEYEQWLAELHARAMGQVLDFVPNHMGIGEPHNLWWMDVLENGPSSMHAPYFDIDWHPLKSDLQGKVLLPILGDQYGRVLERGELKVRFEAGSFFICYYQHELPLAPGTYRYILEVALEYLSAYQDQEFYAEFQSILTALEYLPKRTESDPERIAERTREKKSSSDDSSAVSKKRRRRALRSSARSSRSTGARAIRAVLICWTNCSTPSRTASLSGGSRPRKSITAAFSTSTIWPLSAWNCRRSSTRRMNFCLNWFGRGLSPACASIIRTVFICRRSILKNCRQNVGKRWG
jgi:hypothetical protein